MTKTILINTDIHTILKKYCKENNLKINEYVSKLIENNILLSTDESELPQILRNNRNEIIEILKCTDISAEIKNNMPREITLLKKSKDGSGFIGNYIQK